jgi:hypothetical protein
MLTFDRAYARYSSVNNDTLAILISSDCGTTYTPLYVKGNTALATAPDNTSSLFVPTSTQWKRDTIDLLAYAGQPSVMFAFQNRGFYGQALYLDNINLYSLLTTNIKDLDNGTAINVYPNPSSGHVTIDLSSTLKEDYQLEIFNVVGQKVYTEQLPNVNGSFKKEINLIPFGKGLYILNFTSNKKTSSIKVIVE